MRIFVGVTDFGWFSTLLAQHPLELNFWRAKTRPVFHALAPGELFLFKLHAPRSAIAGGAVFSRYLQLSLSAAWDAFGTANGAPDRQTFIDLVYKERHTSWQEEADARIGAIILAQPFFLPQEAWLPEPDDWSPNIPYGKVYDTDTTAGRDLLARVRVAALESLGLDLDQIVLAPEQSLTFAAGAGSFHVELTRLYRGSCAMTGETAPPALRAVYIRPPQRGGRHSLNNGILLRKDLAELFQLGYVTVGQDYTVWLSPRLLPGGTSPHSAYAALSGRPLFNLPVSFEHWPALDNLGWHKENVFIANKS